MKSGISNFTQIEKNIAFITKIENNNNNQLI